MVKTIYLAAPWKDREQAADAAVTIKKAGFTIAREWWLFEAGDEEHDKLRAQAHADFDAVMAADAMVVIQSRCSEGKAVEQGIALMNCIPIVGIGKPNGNIFQNLEDYVWVSSVDEAVNELRSL